MKNIHVTNGDFNYSGQDRPELDYYATDPKAVLPLLMKEKFNPLIWEPACGGGHISEVLLSKGYNVYSTDIVDRGYSKQNRVIDFMKFDGSFNGDIITNPPYNICTEFVRKSISVVKDGAKVAMLLKLTFLETNGRYHFFDEFPPRTVYVFSGRIGCALNGDFSKSLTKAIAYCWYVWVKGYSDDTTIKWI